MGSKLNYSNIEHTYFEATTSATANATIPAKEIIPYNYLGAYRNRVTNLHTEGCYVEGGVTGRDGIIFPTAAAALAATTNVASKIVRLTDTLYVAIYQATNATLYAIAMTLKGTTLTAGSAVSVNAGDTDSIDICRISNTAFAVLFNDEVGADYLAIRPGSVSTRTITMGTEKTSAIAPTEDEMSICFEPTSACVVAAYADGSDGLSVVACPVSSLALGTLGTLGTAVVLDASSAPTDTAIAPIQAGYCMAVYADEGEDSSYLHAIVFAVSSAGAISGAGTEKTVDTNVAGTLTKAVYVRENTVALGYADASNDPTIQICTTSGASGTTITTGTAVVLQACNAVDFGFDMIDSDQGIAFWCDDDTSDYGFCVRFALSGTGYRTVTADGTIDAFVETSCKGGTLIQMDVACATNGKCVGIYTDASSDPAVIAGQYFENRVIDIRSTATSVSAKFDVEPTWKYEVTN